MSRFIRSSRRRAGLGLVSGVALMLFGAALGAGPAGADEPEVNIPSVETVRLLLMENERDVPVVELDAAGIDSIGTIISEYNMRLIEEVDAAYEAGEYGEVDSKDAKKDAMAAFIFGSQTAFDFFLVMASQEDVIYSTSEADLAEAFKTKFRNPGLYPIVNLQEVRMGLGAYCMRFDVENPEKREMNINGEDMRAWTEQLELSIGEHRVVNIDMKTVSNDRVHLIYTKYAGGFISQEVIEQHGQSLQVVMMEELSGQYVRKFGFHRPEAVVMWRARAERLQAPPKDSRFLGTAMYFPRLKLELPWFLPDLGFHDLRQFDFPEPVLTMDSVKAVRERELDWLKIGKDNRFHNWDGDGDVPEWVEARYPDF